MDGWAHGEEVRVAKLHVKRQGKLEGDGDFNQFRSMKAGRVILDDPFCNSGQ